MRLKGAIESIQPGKTLWTFTVWKDRTYRCRRPG